MRIGSSALYWTFKMHLDRVLKNGKEERREKWKVVEGRKSVLWWEQPMATA
jgi:hypothetical protein